MEHANTPDHDDASEREHRPDSTQSSVSPTFSLNGPQFAGDGLTPRQRTVLALQQTHGNAAVLRMLRNGGSVQRDFAVEPTAPEAEAAALNATQVRRAIRFNQVVFTTPDEIALLRDVLGIPGDPPVIDEDFVNAVARYQAQYGITQDGMVGQQAAQRLADELRGEAGTLGADADTPQPDEMAMTPAQRRMQLRSQVASRLATLVHQGFVGDPNDPSGIVTVRTGDATQGYTNMISVDYTGQGSATAHWLQFVNLRLRAYQPGQSTPTYATGSVGTNTRSVLFSSPTVTHWHVDDDPASGSPFYDVGGLTHETAPHSTRMFDEPGGASSIPFVSAFAGRLTPRPTRVVYVTSFETHLIRNNRSVYRVTWTATTTYNAAVSPVTASDIVYSTQSGGNSSGLPRALKAALDADFPGNSIH